MPAFLGFCNHTFTCDPSSFRHLECEGTYAIRCVVSLQLPSGHISTAKRGGDERAQGLRVKPPSRLHVGRGREIGLPACAHRADSGRTFSPGARRPWARAGCSSRLAQRLARSPPLGSALFACGSCARLTPARTEGVRAARHAAQNPSERRETRATRRELLSIEKKVDPAAPRLSRARGSPPPLRERRAMGPFGDLSQSRLRDFDSKRERRVTTFARSAASGHVPIPGAALGQKKGSAPMHIPRPTRHACTESNARRHGPPCSIAVRCL